MDEQNVQPTVLIKKSDGTFVRVPLSELKKIKPSASSVTVPAPSPAPVAAPVVVKAPVAPIMQPVNPPNTTRADAVIQQLSFSVPANFVNRLRSIVQLRLKDIRDERQTKSTARRSIEAGGLGLTENQADELLTKCAPALAVSPPLSPLVPKPSVPAPVRVPPPAPSPAGRAVMRDMVEGGKTMGPLEEIEYFTLTDLRRLSSDPKQAAARLGQKFVNLRDESYLLFLEAKTRWRQSPLFSSYINLVAEALAQKKTLADLARGGDRPSLAEVGAILEMEGELK